MQLETQTKQNRAHIVLHVNFNMISKENKKEQSKIGKENPLEEHQRRYMQ